MLSEPCSAPTSRRATSFWSGLDEWLLLDRYKWPNNRALRFDWTEILDRKDADTLKAAPPCCTTTASPRRGRQPARKPGRERPQARLRRQRRPQVRPARSHRAAGQRGRPTAPREGQAEQEGLLHRQGAVDAGDLSLECLRLVYRLLFMFYIEARPELGYVPIQKSEIYPKGYSLEACATWKCRQLNTPMPATASISTPPCAGCSSWSAKAAAAASAAERSRRQRQGSLRPGPARQPPVRRRRHAAAQQGALPQPHLAARHPSHVAHQAARRRAA